MDDSRKRNMERRRETSRYAARDRRGKEADIFTDLREVSPLVEEGTVTHLDRIALLRVAVSVCRLRKTAGNVLENELAVERTVKVWNEETISECLDGFVMIVDSDSSILYVTESVAIYLGLTQTDLTGRTLKEFLHSDDYDELIRISGELHKPRERGDEPSEGVHVVFRMKTVISPRGRCLNLKSALFKPVTFTIHSKISIGGHVLLMQGVTIPAGQGSFNSNASTINKYSDAPNGAFMTRHTCDMRISFVSDRLNYILRSELKSLMGTSFYDLVHPADIEIVSKAMKELFAKGHIRTPYYRLVTSTNASAWVQTEATTITHTTKGQKGQYVICVHSVLGIQGSDESLVVCTDQVPAGMQVDIKKEIDDAKDYIGRQPEIVDCVDFTPLISNEDPFECESLRPISENMNPDMGARQNSFDDVLQWLFRDQPGSPPPARCARRMSRDRDPSLATLNCVDRASRASRSSIPLASTSASSPPSANHLPMHVERRARRGERVGDASHGYSTLADGFAQCGISNPPSVKPGEMQLAAARSVVGGVDSSDSTRRFSAVQASDGFDVPVAGLATANESRADLFTSLPAANSNRAASLIVEPIICDNLQWEEPDLSGLAPFVDTCDMLQIDDSLPPELQALYDLPDFTPAAPLMPAAVPVNIENPIAPPPEKRMTRNYHLPSTNIYQSTNHMQYWPHTQQYSTHYQSLS